MLGHRNWLGVEGDDHTGDLGDSLPITGKEEHVSSAKHTDTTEAMPRPKKN